MTAARSDLLVDPTRFYRRWPLGGSSFNQQHGTVSALPALT